MVPFTVLLTNIKLLKDSKGKIKQESLLQHSQIVSSSTIEALHLYHSISSKYFPKSGTRSYHDSKKIQDMCMFSICCVKTNYSWINMSLYTKTIKTYLENVCACEWIFVEIMVENLKKKKNQTTIENHASCFIF